MKWCNNLSFRTDNKLDECKNGAITSPFRLIINLTRSDCEVFDQIGHTQRLEDDRYQADMMVRRVTNLEVVA